MPIPKPSQLRAPIFVFRLPFYLLPIMVGLATGCQLTKPPPVKSQFWLDLNLPSSSHSQPGTGSLQLRPIRVATPFDQKSFVYRRDTVRFESDFYNEFLTQPGVMLTELTRRGLEASPVFRTVLPLSSPFEADYQLEGLATDLLGDYSDPRRPKAVLGLQFWLRRNQGTNSPLILQKNYRIEVPITAQQPETLVRGWSQALQQILGQFDADLSQVVAK
jgi:cholesterol transport system auxiliary component